MLLPTGQGVCRWRVPCSDRHPPAAGAFRTSYGPITYNDARKIARADAYAHSVYFGFGCIIVLLQRLQLFGVLGWHHTTLPNEENPNVRKLQIKVYELSQLALKFERHLLSEVVDFQVRFVVEFTAESLKPNMQWTASHPSCQMGR